MGIKKLSESNTPLDLYCSQKKRPMPHDAAPLTVALKWAKFGELVRNYGAKTQADLPTPGFHARVE